MKKNFLRIYAVSLASAPILSAYAGIASVDLGTILLFLCGLISLLAVGNIKLQLPNGYLPFLFFSIVCSSIVVSRVPLGLILFVLNIIIALNCTKLQYLVKYYSFLVYCSCALFVVQEITFILSGARISGMIPGLPLVYQDISEAYIQRMLTVSRSSSFFLEPAYFAEFLFPFIIIKLFANTKKSRIEAIAVSAIMLLVRSGTGVFLLLIVWGAWFFFGSFKKSTKYSVAVALGFVFTALLLYGGFEQSLYNRTQELDFERGALGESSSGFIRFYRGYYYYAELPFINKLFGAPADVVDSIMNLYYSFSVNKNSTFLNGAQTLLINYGFFSFVFYMRHLFQYCYKVKFEVKVIAVCCVYLMLSESFFLTSKLLLCTILMCLLSMNDSKFPFVRSKVKKVTAVKGDNCKNL